MSAQRVLQIKGAESEEKDTKTVGEEEEAVEEEKEGEDDANGEAVEDGEEEEEPAVDEEASEQRNKVWMTLRYKVLPTLHKLLLRPGVGKKGEKIFDLRGNVAVAMIKLMLKLPPIVLEKRLPAVVSEQQL